MDCSQASLAQSMRVRMGNLEKKYMLFSHSCHLLLKVKNVHGLCTLHESKTLILFMTRSLPPLYCGCGSRFTYQLCGQYNIPDCNPSSTSIFCHLLSLIITDATCCCTVSLQCFRSLSLVICCESVQDITASCAWQEAMPSLIVTCQHNLTGR